MKARKKMIPFLAAFLVLTGVLPGTVGSQIVQAETATGESGQPANEASYIDGYYKNVGWTDNNMFTTETMNYHMNYDLSKGGVNFLSLKVSSAPEADILAEASHSLSPAVQVGGIWYRADNLNNLGENDKAITRKTGKKMWEVVMKDIELADQDGNKLPLTVDQTYYFWNEKFYVVTEWKPIRKITGIDYAELQTVVKAGLFDRMQTVNDGAAGTAAAVPVSGRWNGVPDSITLYDSAASGSHGAFTYEVINKNGTDSVLTNNDGQQGVSLIQRAYDKDKKSGAAGTWEAAHGFKTYTQIFVSGMNGGNEGVADTLNELDPLDASEFKVTKSIPYEGSKSLGYDNTTGTYVVEVYFPDIDYFNTHKNVYPSTKIEWSNDDRPRKIRLQTKAALIGSSKYAINPTGTVSTLTDENMNPLGIPVQVNTKWDDDTGNVNWTSLNMSFTSFDLAPDENKIMWHRSSMQNWGDKPHVGNNSTDIRDYFQRGDLWFEMHVGNAEVLCFGPDTPGVSLYDVRAIYPGGKSGTGNESASGAEFLQVKKDSQWYDSTRRGPGLRFDNYGPNVTAMTMVERSKPEGPQFEITSTSTLIPSLNGTRIFYKVKYEFKEDMSFTDMKSQMRLFSMNDPKSAASRHSKVTYSNAGGSPVSTNLSHNGTYDLQAAPLGGNHPWVALHGSDSGATIGLIMQSVDGQLDGQSIGMNDLAVDVYSASGNVNPVYLVPNKTAGAVKAGDVIEFTAEMYVLKNGTGPEAVGTEATKWPTSVSVQTGTKVSDFPARVQADHNVADFTLSGGAEFIPVSVEGYDSYAEPKLEKFVDGSWAAVDLSVGIKDYWQTDLDESTGKYTFTYALPTDGGAQRYRVSLGTPTVPNIPAVSESRLKNGRAFIEDFSLDEQTTIARRDFGTNKVDITVKEGTDVSKLKPVIKVSDYATISPASGDEVDFTSPVVYTVTAESGAKVNWTVTVHTTEPTIKGAQAPNQSGYPSINPATREVTLYLPNGADVSALSPTFTLGENTSITPASGTARNFSQGPLTYTVMSDEQVPFEWKVKVAFTDLNAKTTLLNEAISDLSGWKVHGGQLSSNEPGTLTSSGNGAGAAYVNRMFGNEILDFGFETDYVAEGAWPIVALRQKDPSGPMFATGSNDGYLVVFKKNVIELQRFKNGQQYYFFNDTPNTYITPGKHRIQFGAMNEESGVRLKLNVDGEQVYDVLDTSADRIMAPGYFSFANWDRPVTLSSVDPATDLGAPKNITGFSMEEQTGPALIDKFNRKVSIEVKAGTNLTTLVPTIQTTEGTTVSPESGMSTDFTDPVVYTVADAEGKSAQWTVTVSKQLPNLASGGVIEATGPDNGNYYSAAKAFDGNPETYWSPQGLTNQSLTIHFGYNAKFNEVVLSEGSDLAYLKNYKLQISSNGTTWTDVPGSVVTAGQRHEGMQTKVITFAPMTAKHLRLAIGGAEKAVLIRELQVHYVEKPYLFTEPEFTENGAPSTDIKAGDAITTTMNIVNNSNTVLPATMVVALYDNTNRLVNAQTVEKQLAVGANQSFIVHTSVPSTGDGYQLKVYLWDSMSTMRVLHQPIAYQGVTPPPAIPDIDAEVPQAGLKAWFNASHVVKDGDNRVSQWTDISDNGKHAVQATPANQPLWVDNAVNGQPVLRFDGQNDSLSAPIGGAVDSYSIAFVLKPDSLKQWNQTFGPGWGKFNFHTSPDGGVFTGTTGEGGQRIEPQDGPGSGTLAVGRWDRILITYQKPEGQSSGTAKLYKNGKLLAVKSLITPQAWTDFNIGIGSTDTIHGDLAELMVYGKALSDAERLQLDAYFNDKYPLTSIR